MTRVCSLDGRIYEFSEDELAARAIPIERVKELMGSAAADPNGELPDAPPPRPQPPQLIGGMQMLQLPPGLERFVRVMRGPGGETVIRIDVPAGCEPSRS